MAAATPLLIRRDGDVLSFVINDAPWNRMSFAYMDALETALDDAAADRAVRALLFTAEGSDNFSVGMDLKQMLRESPARGGWDGVLAQRQRVLDRIESLDKPSISTLFGYCLGGGLEPPLAVAGALRCIVGADKAPRAEALAVERREFLRCAASEDQAEGLRAFTEKRKPVFVGR